MSQRHDGEIDLALRARAKQVIPGGMYGHQNAAPLPEGYPQFFARANGCHVWDVDGREYVDLMCSWGPVLLGHHHAGVDAAYQKQAALGVSMNGPAPALVELAETLVDRIAHADWAMFQKNGTDATTTCVTIARAGTGRRKILVAQGSYHGAVPWCSPSLVGVTTEDRAHVIQYQYNDIASLNAAVQEAGSDLAAVLVTAFRHDIGRDQEMPTVEFAKALRAAATAADAALILDDVRAGFRLHAAGSWEALGVRPDLSAFSKAIANGYPLAAVTGNERFREGASRIYVTGSFWCEAPPMAAAIATLQETQASDTVAHLVAMGQRLRDGLATLARQSGIGIRQTGPVQMPMVLFEDDTDNAKGRKFCAATLRAGAYFHPRHNMFLSAAHQPEDIDRALSAAAAGFEALAA
ncbi:aminotransferase class III-fold pyridoxal phosphate-dependent enzyme [soil metagenome]